MSTLHVSTPSDTEIVMSRGFDAPRHLVFAACTTPELLRRWHGARGWQLVFCEVDLRVGGAYRFVSRGPDGTDMGFGGVYTDVVVPERLEYTESFDDQWYPGESVVSTVFVEHAGRTTMTSTMRYPSREVRDIVLTFPMDRGVSESYEELDQVLAEMSLSR